MLAIFKAVLFTLYTLLPASVASVIAKVAFPLTLKMALFNVVPSATGNTNLPTTFAFSATVVTLAV